MAVFDRHGVGKGVFTVRHLTHVTADQGHGAYLRRRAVRGKAHRLIGVLRYSTAHLRTHGDIRDRLSGAG